MADRGLSHAQVAELCRVSIHTVKAWLKPADNRSHNRMPDAALELLYLKLGLPVPAELAA